MTDTKLYAPVVTLSIEDNSKLFQQSKSGFKRIINWNKYQSKVLIERQNQYLDFLIALSFQRINFWFYYLKMRMIEKQTQYIIFEKLK